MLKGRAAPVNAFEIPLDRDGEALLISVTGMTAIRQIDLRGKIGSAVEHQDDIRRALDRLFTGF